MTSHLQSQGTGLVKGINAFEPYIYRLRKDYETNELVDWPTLILASSLQATAVSIFKLLPNINDSSELLDKRSLASLIRNVVDTHDVTKMIVAPHDSDYWNLHRDILGLYICSHINTVQKFVAPDKIQRIFPHTKTWYWNRIKKSPLYSERMKRLKNGEQIFYQSRRERVQAACGENAEFVLGILADLSAFVHSIPVPLWFRSTGDLYSNNEHNQDTVAVWLRVANFYLARSFNTIISSADYGESAEMSVFTEHFQEVFD